MTRDNIVMTYDSASEWIYQQPFRTSLLAMNHWQTGASLLPGFDWPGASSCGPDRPTAQEPGNCTRTHETVYLYLTSTRFT